MKLQPNRTLPLHQRALSRRQTLRWVGGILATAPLSVFLGCEDSLPTDDSIAAGSGGAGGAGGTAGQAGTAGLTTQAGGGSGSQAGASGSVGSVTTGGWATGGTAALTALASYPDPFEDENLTACAAFCQATLGPCHDDQAPEREDISEGEGGLPMRFGLRILDDNCQPITDADVDIWHCDVRGVYSSGTADNPAFCTGDDAAALAARYFRGHRMTDADGVAWFNTCFPGWYNGRAIHVHFTVRRTSRTGTEYLTSQVAFPSALISELCTSHPDYQAHGLPNTANNADSVFPAEGTEDYEVQTDQMTDGALLAWKTIVIRSSLSDAVCGTSGGGGGGTPPAGGMGQPPGFGG